MHIDSSLPPALARKSARRRRLVGSALVLFGLISGSQMAFARTLTLFSDVSGSVIQNGKPVAGAEIERRYHWHWKDQQTSETTVTDAQGRFQFPAATASSFFGSLIPHEPVVQQTILIRSGGTEYRAWKYTKHNYEANGEVGRALRLRCELGSEDAYHLVDQKTKTGYQGICTLE